MVLQHATPAALPHRIYHTCIEYYHVALLGRSIMQAPVEPRYYHQLEISIMIEYVR